MVVDIICPFYNAEKFIDKLLENLKIQKTKDDVNLRFVLTESDDNSEQKLIKNNVKYKKIPKSEFSHSLTREREAFASNSDILVFISQDIEIKSEDWLENLIAPIKNNECEASFSRQISKYNNIEKYTREFNYPAESYINSKADIDKKGLKTFFFSDASSAIKTEIFKKLGGYDGKILPINEDMYIAYKIIMNGYRIKYCSNSVVYHSHKFTLKQIHDRYYLVGMFMAQNPYLDEFGTRKAGSGLAKYVFKRAIKEFNLPVLFRFLPDMTARLFGMKRGKKDENKRRRKCKFEKIH